MRGGVLLQSFPMVYVDQWIPGETYYAGVRSHPAGEERHALLWLEGMGQTVEYNVRSREELAGKKLLLAAVKSLELTGGYDGPGRLIFQVQSIEKRLAFYTSQVDALSGDGHSLVMRAVLVHKICD